jgi:hypothetical protein
LRSPSMAVARVQAGSDTSTPDPDRPRHSARSSMRRALPRYRNGGWIAPGAAREEPLADHHRLDRTAIRSAPLYGDERGSGAGTIGG